MKQEISKALKKAFPYTIPIMASFLCLGSAYGILMKVSGLKWWIAIVISATVFGGSLQFVSVSMLLEPFSPLSVFLMGIMIQARHIFYGISMLEKLKDVNFRKAFIIFGMCDESFSINMAVNIPEDIDKGWFMFFVTLLNWLYWIIGTTIGSIAGNIVSFNTEGLDFMMTAMFVVIFLEQLLKERKHYSAIIGIISTITCRLMFGIDNFLIPSMICIILLLTLFRTKIGEGRL